MCLPRLTSVGTGIATANSSALLAVPLALLIGSRPSARSSVFPPAVANSSALWTVHLLALLCRLGYTIFVSIGWCHLHHLLSRLP